MDAYRADVSPSIHALETRGMNFLFEKVSVELGYLGQPHPTAVLCQKLLEQALGVGDLGSS